MKSYFVAALSFVGVLGSAAGAMAINNETLAHGGTDLTAASSKTLVSTAQVNEATVNDPSTGRPSAAPGSGPSDSSISLAPKLSLSLQSYPQGTTGGSSSSPAAASPAGRSNQAHPISTPAPAPAGSGWTNGTTSGSSAPAPAPGPAPSTPATAPGTDGSGEPQPSRSGDRRHRGRVDHSPRILPTAPAEQDDDSSSGDD